MKAGAQCRGIMHVKTESSGYEISEGLTHTILKGDEGLVIVDRSI